MALQNGDPAAAFALFSGSPSWRGALATRTSRRSAAWPSPSLISMGEVSRGVAFLDEAMLAVTAGEVGPITVGTVYCAAIEAFGEVSTCRAQDGPPP